MLTGVASYLADMYREGKVTEAKLESAVTKGWIAEEEKNEIIGT